MSRISFVESRLPTDKELGVATLENLNKLQPKMLDMHPSNWKKGFKVRDIDFENIHLMTNSDYRIYSAGIFKDGKAVDDNWVEQDILILDIDDGLTIAEALDKFKDYKALITTTKSHMVEKNGHVCDRFRILIPLKETFNGSINDYRMGMKFLLHNIFTFADDKCKDPSRIYFGKSNAEYFYTNGDKLFNFSKYIHDATRLHRFRAEYVPKIKQEPKHDGTKIDWYRENWLNDNMARALKIDEKFVEGGRNTTLYSYARLFQDMGMSDSEVVEIVMWINKGQLDEKEIENTIFKSLRISS